MPQLTISRLGALRLLEVNSIALKGELHAAMEGGLSVAGKRV